MLFVIENSFVTAQEHITSAIVHSSLAATGQKGRDTKACELRGGWQRLRNVRRDDAEAARGRPGEAGGELLEIAERETRLGTRRKEIQSWRGREEGSCGAWERSWLVAMGCPAWPSSCSAAPLPCCPALAVAPGSPIQKTNTKKCLPTKDN